MPYILNQRCHWDLVLVACWDSSARIQVTCYICRLVRNVLSSAQSFDVRPACLSLNSSLVYNKAVPVQDEREMLLLPPRRWDCCGCSGPQATQIVQTLAVKGLRGQCHLLSQLSGSSQCLNRKTLFQMESNWHRSRSQFTFEYRQSATEIKTILKLPYCRKRYFYISVDYKAALGTQWKY